MVTIYYFLHYTHLAIGSTFSEYQFSIGGKFLKSFFLDICLPVFLFIRIRPLGATLDCSGRPLPSELDIKFFPHSVQIELTVEFKAWFVLTLFFIFIFNVLCDRTLTPNIL